MSTGGSDAVKSIPEDANAETRVEAFTQEADLSWVTELLTSRREEILARWFEAASEQPFHKSRSSRAIDDHIPDLFNALLLLLKRHASPARNAGVPLEDPAVLTAAQSHAKVRFAQGFSAPDVVVEFRLLRQEIGRALRLYVSDRSPTSDVVGAELLLHDALDGAVFLALSELSEHEEARKKAEAALSASERRFRLLMESVEEYAIFTLSAAGAIDSWNEGAEHILGHAREQVLGQPIEQVLSDTPEHQGITRVLLEEAARDGRVVHEGLYQRSDGTRFHAQAAIAALHDETQTLIGFALILHDITARKLLEEERAFASREREALFTTLGHDLKSPLASASAIAQLLQHQLKRGKLDLDTLGERLSTVEVAMRRSALRVDELMEIVRLDAAAAHSADPLAWSTLPTPTVEHVELLTLVREMLERYRLTYRRHQFELTTSAEEITGAWSRDQVERCLDNLLSNAVKYSPDGGAVTVRVQRSTDGSAVEIVITDHGRGIPAHDLATLFTRFQRGSNVTDLPGSGVGLWSVRRIVEGYGGTLTVTSTLGAGSAFTLRLPLQAA